MIATSDLGRRFEFASAFLFLCGCVARRIGFGGGVEAEDAQVVGGFAGFGERGVERFGFVGFNFENEAVCPRLAVNRAALDFAEIDIVASERLESCEERAGAMSELHRDRHFARVGGGCDCGGVGFAAQQDEARKIFGVVLDVFGQDDAVVVVGGAASGDGGGDFVAAAEDFADAAGGVFGGDAPEERMLSKEAFALRQRHGMRRDGLDLVERGAGDGDEVEFDGKDCLGGDREAIFEHEVVDADDRAGERVFDGDEQSVGGIFRDGAEDGVEGGARDGGCFGTEELNGGGFAESAGLALEGDAEWLCLRR